MMTSLRVCCESSAATNSQLVYSRWVQLLCNCFAASSQLPHLHISFACEILFAVISPWSSSDLAAIVATPHFFTWVFPASVLSPHSDFIQGRDVHSLMPSVLYSSHIWYRSSLKQLLKIRILCMITINLKSDYITFLLFWTKNMCD